MISGEKAIFCAQHHHTFSICRTTAFTIKCTQRRTVQDPCEHQHWSKSTVNKTYEFYSSLWGNLFLFHFRVKNMLRPSIEEFCEWAKSNSNMSRIRNSLSTYPDLVEIKDHVSYDWFLWYSITIFLFDILQNIWCYTNWSSG